MMTVRRFTKCAFGRRIPARLLTRLMTNNENQPRRNEGYEGGRRSRIENRLMRDDAIFAPRSSLLDLRPPSWLIFPGVRYGREAANCVRSVRLPGRRILGKSARRIG